MTEGRAREVLQEQIEKYGQEYNAEGIEALEMAIKVLEQQSKTGHWSRKTKVDAYDIDGVKTWGIKCQCDRCDFTTIVVEDFGYYKYCPNCRAKMEGEDETDN